MKLTSCKVVVTDETAEFSAVRDDGLAILVRVELAGAGSLSQRIWGGTIAHAGVLTARMAEKVRDRMPGYLENQARGPLPDMTW